SEHSARLHLQSHSALGWPHSDVPFRRLVMRRAVLAVVLAVAGFAAYSSLSASPGAPPPAAPDVDQGTRMLRSPSVSATQIAFAYANNIWTVERSGGLARRITSFQGQTTNPHFSPDGKWIAFSGQYAGNIDVYVVPAAGGEPKRLTWHPGSDE